MFLSLYMKTLMVCITGMHCTNLNRLRGLGTRLLFNVLGTIILVSFPGHTDSVAIYLN